MSVATSTAEKAMTLPRAAGPEYFPIALFARLPFAMNVVGVLTLVVAARESLALGGLTSAVCGIGTAIVGPFLGAAADKYGQRAVLLIAAIANSVALLFMAWIAYQPVADLWVLAAALLIGATAPQVSPLSRSRLVGLVETRIAPQRRPKVLSAVLAYESAIDEMVFVFGPVIVGILAVAVSPAAALIGSAALTVLAVGAFALHRTARTHIRHDGAAPVAQAPARQLFTPGVLVLVFGMLSIGFFFGATLTALTSFMADRGDGSLAGLFYGVMGVGSALLALSVALMPHRFTPRYRWLVFSAILLTGAVAISMATDIPSMVFGLVLAGIGIGPMIVTVFTFATQRTPEGRSATVMTMVGSGVIVGQSLASAVVGSIGENLGTHAALLAAPIAAALVLLTGLANWFFARRD